MEAAARAMTREGLVFPLLLPVLLAGLPGVARAAAPPWKGSAILGGGGLTAVYSDDPRIVRATGRRGVQHLYVGDYATDCVAATAFDLRDGRGRVVAGSGAPISVGMDEFFSTLTRTRLEDGSEAETRCFAHPDHALVLSLRVRGAKRAASLRCEITLRKTLVTDRGTALDSLAATTEGIAVARWSSGPALAFALRGPGSRVEVRDSTVVLEGPLPAGGAPADVIVAAGASTEEALALAARLRDEASLARAAAEHWRAWVGCGLQPAFPPGTPGADRLLEAYRRNLYAAKAACLRGQIPADVTGQFVTHGMPQLYPRDAMMCARVFLLTGHPAEAREVLEFWADPRIPRRSAGEWYARYDARGRAVDAGTGARYDEPEWDASGYFITLAARYRERTGGWPVAPGRIHEAADFLASRLDREGLLYEGGIVEWTGYLPATNMICSAALETASGIAAESGDREQAKRWMEASRTIAASLGALFDRERRTYADVRFSGSKGLGGADERAGARVHLWDTSANFGVLWGYPDHAEMEETNAFYRRACERQGGGLQYFEALDRSLAGYGRDVFFFTTAAAAQYHALRGDREAACRHVDWMLANANAYGLMPERIFLDASDCSPASPLSWCCAEFAAAVLLLAGR